ncbi:MAG: hypothetical protein V1661_02260 [bacterium]
MFLNREKLSKQIFNPQIWHNAFYIYNFFISFTLLLLAWGEAVFGLFAFRNAVSVTLHYSIYFGVDWLGGRYNFFVFSGIATFVFLANFLLANAFYGKKRLLSYYLSASASLVLLVILIGISLVLYINWGS